MPDEVTTLSDIEEDAQNANLGTERGAFALQESLVRFGPGRSILVDRKGRLIAGEKCQFSPDNGPWIFGKDGPARW